MSTPPESVKELAALISTASSSSALLETFMNVEGDISLRFGDTHMTSDTEFMTVYFSAYIFVLLLEDQINEGRMLTRRMPQSLKNAHPVMQNSLALLLAAWNNEYPRVYQTLRQSDWPEPLNQLAKGYETYFQNKIFTQLGAAYETIRPSSVAYYLGLDSTTEQPPPDFITALTSKGWEYDADKKLFHPVPTSDNPSDSGLDKIRIGKLATLIGGHGSNGV